MLSRPHSRSDSLSFGVFLAVAASLFLLWAPQAISQNLEPLNNANALSKLSDTPTADSYSTNIYLTTTADDATSPSGTTDSAYNYAFLNNTAMVPKSAILRWLQKKNMVPEHWQAEAKPAFRPFASWTRWINNRVLFFPSASFILVASLLSWYFAPQLMDQAESESEKNYWRSLGTGLVAIVCSMMLIRSVLITLIGSPLAIILIGIMQLFLVLGISVITSMIGRSISFYAKVPSLSWFATRRNALRLCELTIGSVVIALLLQLGSPGGLPRVGTRLALLVAILGTGAILRIIAARKRRA